MKYDEFLINYLYDYVTIAKDVNNAVVIASVGVVQSASTNSIIDIRLPEYQFTDFSFGTRNLILFFNLTKNNLFVKRTSDSRNCSVIMIILTVIILKKVLLHSKLERLMFNKNLN